MSETSFLLLLSGGGLLAFGLATFGIAMGLYHWGKPRRHARR